ncbi:2-succinyl-5-enolpyruvyl-6-hydroxy-3-cyclohexene-1-carboxylate synthase [Antricoccus suffuscus]|uniref:2-succinyl-5-enolpyruvyl-6-hydroxy-3-cyclohexene-1-carboxylate synthase n=1 Tax=Antricoccus suffuscus TaxID=1629062 RepID=A0A2T0ZS66_9ACTN|nr:2-succinyl-5-enolpyruvyl-6-hydroxy-3-cyclohexene-1-carboxylic-acid synthase [Antricoccus suffuscus]PRZ39097.1 2-succinyl-5-enolpyruvyl-6-hydroxy-3-cyclohexene-1-carboxylate synthase [Antricoccus suffuscus]
MTADRGPANDATACATVIIDELVRGGVREFVMSPGSRNAPLSFALLEAQDAGRLRIHVRIDERSAAFLALGLAKATGTPTALMCTSGTALANFHPAIVEADMSGTPLVVVSANRPQSLWGTGANQTIDQVGIFGRATRDVVHLPAVGGPPANALWRSRVCRILAAATGTVGRPGPVQLDVGFAEPLTPSYDESPSQYPGRANGEPWTAVIAAPRIEGEISPPRRTLVFVGETSTSLAASAVSSACEAGFPVHVEAGTSLAAAQRGCLDAGSWLLADEKFLDDYRPDHVVIVGRPTLARSIGKLTSRPRVGVSVISDHGEWSDPTGKASTTLVIDTVRISGTVDTEFATAWRDADRRATGAVRALDAGELDGGVLDAGEVAAVVTGAGADVLLVASSNPIRDVDLRAQRRAANVVVNRGAAGIDGLVSTAIGVALSVTDARLPAPQAKAVALLGDLALLHDSNGLVIGPDEPRPRLTIVVVNNDGGAIFASLEQGAPEYAAQFERIFGTPHGVDIASLCAATGTTYVEAKSASELALLLAQDPAGIRVIEVKLDRAEERRRRLDHAEAVSRAIHAR